MVIGIGIITFRLHDCRSLKGKRKILKSIITRVRNRFNVSVADVGDQNLWQRAVLVVAVVSNDGRFANEVLSKVLRLITSEPRVEMLDQKMDYL